MHQLRYNEGEDNLAAHHLELKTILFDIKN